MTLGERCDEIVRLIDETLGGMTTPVPPRRRRPVGDAVGTTPTRIRTLDGSLTLSPDLGPNAA